MADMLRAGLLKRLIRCSPSLFASFRLAGGGGPPSSPNLSYGTAGDRGPGGDFGMQASGNPYKKPVHDGPRHPQTTSTHQSQFQASSGGMGPNQSPGQHASRRSLQVDFSGGGRRGRSPSASPDRASAPSSPYSVPQIAPMPSSKLCPVCNTTELTNVDGSPNFNKCTQCHTTACNQCGFNPNPHLIGVRLLNKWDSCYMIGFIFIDYALVFACVSSVASSFIQFFIVINAGLVIF